MERCGQTPAGGPVPGSRIQAVRASGPHEVLLETYGAGHGPRRWILSAHPQAARLVECFDAPRSAAPPSPVVLALRSWLVGGHVAGLTLRQGHVLDLSIVAPQGEYRLILEMRGSASDLVVLHPGEHVRMRMHGAAAPEPSAPDEPPLYALPAPWHDRGETPSRLPAANAAAARQLDRDWRAFLDHLTFWEAQGRAQRMAKAHLKKLERRLAKLREDEAACADAERWREWGELLKIHLGEVRAGQVELRVPNVFVPGSPEQVLVLDPQLGGAGNMARLFHRYRKARAGLPHVRRRVEESLAEQARWSQALRVVEQATGLAEVEGALAGLVPPGTGAAQPSRSARAEAPEAPALRRMSVDGLLILVGRSAQENDSLTFKVGRGRDWWFHAAGVSGAHVLVQMTKDSPLPPATLREAAWLAAYYSKGRNQGQLEVTYTQRKHVRRVKGGKPGQATVGQARTAWVDLADAEARHVLERMPSAP